MKLKNVHPNNNHPPSRIPSGHLEGVAKRSTVWYISKRLLPSEDWKQITNHKLGFTMVELLIVMAIMTTLTTLVFVSLDPITRFSEARNSRRTTDVNSVLTAVHEYVIDNDGTLPGGATGIPVAPTPAKQLGSCASGGATLCTGAQAACLDLSGATLLGKYLKSMPTDPGSGTSATTGYSVQRDTNNIISVNACQAELSEIITASR